MEIDPIKRKRGNIPTPCTRHWIGVAYPAVTDYQKLDIDRVTPGGQRYKAIRLPVVRLLNYQQS